MKAEYISDPTVSHRSLAAKYGVSSTIVSKRAAQEGWSELRKVHSEKVVQGMLDERARASAQVLARFSAAAEKALEKVEAALKDEDHFYRYLVAANAKEKEETGLDQVERVYKTLNAKALKEVADTTKELLAIYRDASGNPGWGAQFTACMSYLKLENERERLAIERAKASEGGADKDITVTFEGQETDYDG